MCLPSMYEKSIASMFKLNGYLYGNYIDDTDIFTVSSGLAILNTPFPGNVITAARPQGSIFTELILPERHTTLRDLFRAS